LSIKYLSAHRLLWFVLANTLFWSVCYQLHWVTAVENGGMENAQALAIFLSSILFLLSAMRRQFPERVLFLALTLLCLSFLLRELDMEDLGLNPMVTWLTSGIGRNLVVSLSWSFFLLFTFFYRDRLWKAFRAWAISPEGKVMILAGTFFVLAWPFDKEFLPILSETSRFFEELLELNGCMLIWISSLFSFSQTYSHARLWGLVKRGSRARLSMPSEMMSRLLNSLTNGKSHAANIRKNKKY
jgi:hypothetical protein